MTRLDLRDLAESAACEAMNNQRETWSHLDKECRAVAAAVLAAVEGAIRAKALEEAAKVCDAYAEEMQLAVADCDPDVQESLADCAVGARECAVRIEALARAKEPK
jgi:hypothetical protein